MVDKKCGQRHQKNIPPTSSGDKKGHNSAKGLQVTSKSKDWILLHSNKCSTILSVVYTMNIEDWGEVIEYSYVYVSGQCRNAIHVHLLVCLV